MISVALEFNVLRQLYAGLSQAGGPGGHIIPTQYYVPSRIFRPCDGPDMYALVSENIAKKQ